MSPTFLGEKLNIDRVAITGAGSSGLAAASSCPRATVGGIWNYTPLTVVDNDFSIPRSAPSKISDTAVWMDDESPAQFVSPIYDSLETNIPHVLMNYSDTPFPSGSSLFPCHGVVLEYLKDYASGLNDGISFTLETQVLAVRKITGRESSRRCWEVEVLHLKTKQRRSLELEAVMVASGHYNDPYIPDIQGLAEFNEKHPGAISHSEFYRRPEEYTNKKVIVVGNFASGIDISVQVSKVCQSPVIVSEKEKEKTMEDLGFDYAVWKAEKKAGANYGIDRC